MVSGELDERLFPVAGGVQANWGQLMWLRLCSFDNIKTISGISAALLRNTGRFILATNQSKQSSFN